MLAINVCTHKVYHAGPLPALTSLGRSNVHTLYCSNILEHYHSNERDTLASESVDS